MKKILIACSLFISSIALAKIPIYSAHEPLCFLRLPQELKLIKPQQTFVSDGNNVFLLDLPSIQRTLTNSLEKWMIELDIAQDPVIETNQKALCFGFYDDKDGANALAYSDVGIVFGKRLLMELPVMSKATFTDATKFILAHEFAHNLQFRHGLKFNYILPMLSTKIKELQADCIAGYFLRAHNEVKLETQLQLKTLIEAIGDPHSVGDHGMAADRQAAFQAGISKASHDILLGKKAFQVKSIDIINHCEQHYKSTK